MRMYQFVSVAQVTASVVGNVEQIRTASPVQLSTQCLN